MVHTGNRPGGEMGITQRSLRFCGDRDLDIIEAG